jgi:glutamate-5-semialdehyde dehydrogenase
MTNLEIIGKEAKKSAHILANSGITLKNSALNAIAEALNKYSSEIIKANEKDIEAAEKAGLSKSLVDRLSLNEARIADIADGVRKVIALEDPIGKVDGMWTRPNGLKIGKMRVPLGVIGVIYEARPNVTVDVTALCIKSGNAVIMRGGKEAINSNICIANIMREAIESIGLPMNCIQLIEDTSRESAGQLMRLNAYLDVLIPRGGAGLIKSVVENATVPIIETGTGNCHIYMDQSGNIEDGLNILFNAKTSRPSVCNAAEKLLVHKAIANEFLPLAKAKLDEKNVKLRGCPQTIEILGESVELATEEDWYTEYLDYILGIKVVDSLEDAIAHINQYSSHHSEAIITQSYQASEKFLKEIDSAAVYVNASTRFTDGYEFGFGAEVGISTQKLHARGPMGLNELTTIKYIVYGNGQIR